MKRREASSLSGERRPYVLAALVVILLLILLFGGLGLFVAKIFLLGILLAILVGAVMSFANRRGHTHV